MKNTKILIVEDEILIAEDLKDTLQILGFTAIELAHDKKTALQKLETFCPQITLLDIRLEKDTEGIEIGNFIASKKLGQFIYITAHSDVEMVKKIIYTNPSAYITKPVKKSDLFASISLALEQSKVTNSVTRHLAIKDGYDTVKIDMATIRFVEAEGNYLNIHCVDKKYVARQSMESFIKELDSDMFYKIHRSFLVNVRRIVRYSKKEICLDNGKIIPVSRNIKADFESFMKIKSD